MPGILFFINSSGKSSNDMGISPIGGIRMLGASLKRSLRIITFAR
jgi:hypothetical protein